MRYKIDIWHTDKKFNEVQVDPEVHDREPEKFKRLIDESFIKDKLTGKTINNPDLRLSETILTKCKVNSAFMCRDADAYGMHPFKQITIELEGYLYKPEEVYENTKKLAEWANEATEYAESSDTSADRKYRKLLLRVMSQKDSGIFKERTYRIFYLPRAEVTSYAESYDTVKGAGAFAMTIRQDPANIDGVIIDAPKAGKGFFKGLTALSKGLEAAGKVVDMASSTVAFAASGVVLVEKASEMLTGKKIDVLDKVSKGMTDASGLLSGLGGLAGASADRSLSRTERANKAAQGLKNMNKGFVELDKETVPHRAEEWKENERQNAAKKALEQKKNQAKAVADLKDAFDKELNDKDNTALKAATDQLDKSRSAAVEKSKAQQKAQQAAEQAQKKLLDAMAQDDPQAVAAAKADLAAKNKELTEANQELDAANQQLDTDKRACDDAYNNLSAKKKASYSKAKKAYEDAAAAIKK